MQIFPWYSRISYGESYNRLLWIDTVLVENEIYGLTVVKSVVDGGHYARGKRGLSLISEALEHLQLSAFMESIDGEKYKELFKQIGELQNLLQVIHLDHQSIRDSWVKHQANLGEFNADFDAFKRNGCKSSQQFEYWHTFLNEVAPVLRDLTRSHREADWKLHMSAVRRALPLCFTFDIVNYKRWLPIYYEDCTALPQNFPTIYAFAKGGYVVKHTNRCGSSVPMDQALEKAYIKPAKGQSGIIGVTCRKEAVCNRNIIKHDKAQFTNFLYELCALNYDDEYTLHHEFSKSITDADKHCVN